MASDLSAKDIERAKFAFSVYDMDGSGTIDALYVGDILRVLNLNPSLKLIEKVGGTKKKGEKKLKVEEFLPMFSAVKKEIKDFGNVDDFVEVLKLYDKQNNNTMMLAELSHVLQSLGEVMTKEEAEGIIKDCADAEDDEGYFPFKPFLKRLMAGPFPEAEDA